MLYTYQILVITSAYLTSHLLFRVFVVSINFIINHQNKENIKNVIHISNTCYYKCLPDISLTISRFCRFYDFIINHQNKENIKNVIHILNTCYYECIPDISLTISYFCHFYYVYHKSSK